MSSLETEARELDGKKTKHADSIDQIRRELAAQKV